MTAQTIELENLITEIAKGDRTALARFYESTQSAVYGFALSVLRNRPDAEDVMHDAYLKLWQSAGSYQPMGKPLAFLLTITKRLAYNRLRDEKNTEDLSDYKSGGEDLGNEQAEDRMLLNTAFQVLDETECTIVILHAVTGWKHREIAELLDMRLNAVLSKYNRALKKMKRELERKGVLQ